MDCYPEADVHFDAGALAGGHLERFGQGKHLFLPLFLLSSYHPVFICLRNIILIFILILLILIVVASEKHKQNVHEPPTRQFSEQTTVLPSAETVGTAVTVICHGLYFRQW